MQGKFQNDIDELSDLELFRYENLFKIYQTGKNNFYYYNILKKIKLPDDLNNNFFDFIVLKKETPLTTISYEIYKTTYLWWLILVVNNIENPVKNLPTGKKLRFIKNEYIKDVMDSITSQLQ